MHNTHLWLAIYLILNWVVVEVSRGRAPSCRETITQTETVCIVLSLLKLHCHSIQLAPLSSDVRITLKHNSGSLEIVVYGFAGAIYSQTKISVGERSHLNMHRP